MYFGDSNKICGLGHTCKCSFSLTLCGYEWGAQRRTVDRACLPTAPGRYSGCHQEPEYMSVDSELSVSFLEKFKIVKF